MSKCTCAGRCAYLKQFWTVWYRDNEPGVDSSWIEREFSYHRPWCPAWAPGSKAEAT